MGGRGTILRTVSRRTPTGGSRDGALGSLEVSTGYVVEDGLIGRGRAIIGLCSKLGGVEVLGLIRRLGRLGCGRGPNRDTSSALGEIGRGRTMMMGARGSRLAASNRWRRSRMSSSSGHHEQ